MTPDDRAGLEHEIDRALKTLPSPRAPRSLLPRVIQAAQERPQAAPSRPWFAWEWPLQAAVLVVTLALVGLAGWLWPDVDLRSQLPAPVQSAGQRVDALGATFSDLLHAGRLVWDAVFGPILKGVLTITLVLCTACALLAAALGRLALGGSHQS